MEGMERRGTDTVTEKTKKNVGWMKKWMYTSPGHKELEIDDVKCDKMKGPKGGALNVNGNRVGGGEGALGAGIRTDCVVRENHQSGIFSNRKCQKSGGVGVIHFRRNKVEKRAYYLLLILPP